MYSTPKKRLFELKKELKSLKKRMDKKVKISERRNEEPHSYGLEYETNWSTLSIITSDYKMYTLDCTTIYFPKEINFKKILYINKSFDYKSWKNKKTGKWYDNSHIPDSYDSLRGYYDGKSDQDYFDHIRNKFHVKETIYLGFD